MTPARGDALNARADRSALAAMRGLEPETLATRQQIHANPELGFEAINISDRVGDSAKRLAAAGLALSGLSV